MFPAMHTILTPAEKGAAKIIHYEVSRHEAAMASLRLVPTRAGTFAVLKVNGATVMSDMHHERITNLDVVQRARGDVLIGGLGLGMILHPILAKPEVDRVTVIEICRDVIDLVSPSLPCPEKLDIIQADALEWKPPKGLAWDTIYWDIWPDICLDNLPEMTRLHRRFGRRLRPGGWMGSWCRHRLLAERRRERRSAACW